MRMLSITRVLILVVFCLGVNVGFANNTYQAGKPIQWAGVSIAGDFAKASALMPTLHELMTKEAGFSERFEARVVQAVNQVSNLPSGLKIVVDEQLRQGDDSYALTFVLAGESVTSYKIEQTTFVDYLIQALVLVGNVSKDPTKQRIVTSYPVQVKFQRAYPDGRQPQAIDRKNVIAGMLLGNAGQADLVKEWQKRLLQVQLRERDQWIAVNPLRILPEAMNQGGLTKEQAEKVTFKASSAIEGNISRTANIPIVPSTTDQNNDALGILTLSFADRGIVAFRKPDPSYLLQVTVFGLGSRTAEEKMTRETKFAVAYGGGFQIEYFSLDADRKRIPELSMRLQSVQSVTYIGTTSNAHQTSQGDMFTRLISGFADELSNNLIPANPQWLDKNKASSESRSAQELARLISAKLPAPRN